MDKWSKIIKKTLLATVFISSLLNHSAITLANDNEQSVEIAQTTSSQYKDYKNDQYWSENMVWAIEQGLIQGYTKHPRTGASGNWLMPTDPLTEAQFITVLFRQTKREELDTTEARDPDYWASIPYQLAEKYDLSTKANLSNLNRSIENITRGQMAIILAELHFGQKVNERKAVQFMYDAGLSNGYPDVLGDVPKTYDSYKVYKELQRAHIVTFMKNYDTFLKSGKDVQLIDTIKVGNIDTLYGRTYGVKTQEEYDAVIEEAKKAIEGYEEIEWGVGSASLAHYYERYFNGERPWDEGLSYNDQAGLGGIDGRIGYLYDTGVSFETLTKAMQVQQKALRKSGSVPQGTSSSAYDVFINNKLNSNTRAQAISAMFDVAGFETKIYRGFPLIKIQGSWWDITGSQFRRIQY
ncbi:hypothetical protein BKP35_08955 [Anaerobacillus arseniciselenatis]|uniref:SLH domain-containing protein n=1 Tax=Anaerobacillus arseniciselenatis TaxID=85682 RepID=A0A1S2LML4_9BACI|nr:hypothetical protein [Anaerobacillus arseniciselenatis]OIJ13353.1 hypothetical protein BKP35_08955 [Anaerobacillus arseniciselenatis]